MFEPHAILDQNDSFLEPTSTGAGVKAAAAGGIIKLRSARLVWLPVIAGLSALGTWAVLRSQDTGQSALVSTAVPPLENSRPHVETEEKQPQATTSIQPDNLEPIHPQAGRTPRAIDPHALPDGAAVEATATPPNISRERVRVASVAPIHSGPSVSDALLGTAQVGAEAEVASRDADWVEIVDPVSGKAGWINSDHLEPAPSVGEQSPNNETNQLPAGEQQAALSDEQEALPLPPPPPSVKNKSHKYGSKTKSRKYGWRKKRYKRGLVIKFAFRRFR